MNDRLIALVTGATSGFGFETSRFLARQGYRVYGTFRNAKKCGPLKGLAKALDIIPIYMDVNREATVKKAVAVIFRKESRLDVLVNNAGFVVAGFLGDLTDEELKAQFETNVFGLLRVTREVLPIMRRQGKGKIVNIGSNSGIIPFPGIGAYIMSKFAVRSISEGIRQEVRPFGIEVCEIAPGAFNTQIVPSTRFARKAGKDVSPFREYSIHTEGVIEKDMAKGRPASEVAELILKALNDQPMKPVYLAGRDAKLSVFLKRRLPDSWFEWILGLSFPWSRFPKQ